MLQEWMAQVLRSIQFFTGTYIRVQVGKLEVGEILCSCQLSGHSTLFWTWFSDQIDILMMDCFIERSAQRNSPCVILFNRDLVTAHLLQTLLATPKVGHHAVFRMLV